MPNNIRVGTQITGVGKASSDLDRLRDKFDKVQKQGVKGFGLGIGAAVGVAGFSLLDSAASSFIGFMGDAVHAAEEEEVSIQKLGTALKANIPNWDGNTEAIEKVLKARMALGFSDDEQRDSLAKLVAATHDINQALAIEKTAMDLARFKGISLADASEALTKVEAGSYRILKSLGIVLKDGATQTEALAAVQAVAAGQAEDYANTNEGKLLVSQVKVNEAMEKFGKAVLPLVAEGASSAADAITGLAGTFDFYQSGLAKTTDGQKEQVQSSLDLLGALSVLSPGYGLVASAEQDMLDKSVPVMTGMSDHAGKMADDVTVSLGDMADASGDMKSNVVDDAKDVAKAWDDVRDSLFDDAQSMIDDFFDPIEIRSDLHAKRVEIAALEVERANAKTAKSQRAIADKIIDALDDEGSKLVGLGRKHKLTAKDVKNYETDVKKSYAAMGRKIPPEIQAIINKLRILAGLTDEPFEVRIKGSGYKGGARARGGPAHGETLVGEEGPEIVDLPAGSYVHDAQATKQMMQPTGNSWGGGGTTIYQVTVNAGAGSGLTAGSARALAEQIGPAVVGYMQRNGHLRRGTTTGLTG